MDNLCHTLVGAAMGEAGLKRRTRLGMAALVVGANLPDIDVLSLLAPHPAGLGFRRGLTHGLPVLVALPFLLTGALWVWNRLLPRREPGFAFVPGQVLLLSGVAILSHPFLDFLNVYGMRWLLPFSGAWVYGDTLYIVDLWVTGVLVVGVWWSRRAARAARRDQRAAAPDGRTVTNDGPAPPHDGHGPPHDGHGPTYDGHAVGQEGRAAARPYGGHGGRPARVALVAVAAYILVMAGNNFAARRIVRRDLGAAGVPDPEHLMVAPEPITPFARNVVAARGDRVWRATFDWRRDPRVVLTSSVAGDETRASSPAARAAAATLAGRTYLSWARFPTFDVQWTGRCRVTLGDVRYEGSNWAQAAVDVDLARGECR